MLKSQIFPAKELTIEPIASISIAIFLPNLEISIVSTSLVAITDELHGFSQTGWIVVAYLITYTGIHLDPELLLDSFCILRH